MAFEPQNRGLRVALVPNDFPDIPKPTKYHLHKEDGRQAYEAALDDWWHKLKESLLKKIQEVKDSR